MGKKVKKGGISDVVEAPTIDLKTLIHDHAQFFDKLIELIPAKFYLPVDEDSKPWVQGLSKVKKATLKQQTRENIKQSRRDRLDPEKAQTTTLDLLKKSIDKAENDNKDSDDEDDDDEEEEEIEIKVKPMTSFDGETSKVDKSVTYEELQQRLHHKLEMLRSNRGQGKRTMMMNEVRQRPDFTDKKRKREDRDNSNSGKTASGSGKDKGKGKEKIEPDFEFGKLKLGDEDGSRKKAKKVSKVQELEKAKKLREAKTENVVVATKHSWKAATEKAMGGKVHDDPSRLKKSIQKDKKKRERSAGKWKERVETQDKLREEKQSKRRGNIDERANQKKARKIAKREKKLMRPGFEGKKEGYIGDK
ncbi:surfeit locus protein 6 [Artemisia annua]|uniref:Surfeit locus protein 6 n=1 Tax=Artemisia annua TaxID=35608 RepID=A0A2U1MRA1_ARTAN|nr:surfeit locus protein 6 [Artemisia annua]